MDQLSQQNVTGEQYKGPLGKLIDCLDWPSYNILVQSNDTEHVWFIAHPAFVFKYLKFTIGTHIESHLDTATECSLVHFHAAQAKHFT